MISIYQVFKLIFGLIVSAVMLFFLINYSSIYGSTQADINRALIMKNFMKAAQDVYMTGNPTNFSDFSRLEFDLTFRGSSDPAVIKSNTGYVPNIPVRIPLFFVPGREVFIDRNHLDYDFWKFYFVEAVPETIIIFTITGADNEYEELTESIVRLLPSTTYFTPKVLFGFCSGTTLIKPCGIDDFCEREQFDASGYILQQPCTNTELSAKKYRLVTISIACNPASRGICIEPRDDNWMGDAYMSGSRYLYKDAADLVALIIGGEEEDIFGTVQGEMFYNYKNKVFRERLLLASKIFSQRANLIRNHPQSNSDCREDYLNFADALVDIQDALSEPDYYTSRSIMLDLISSIGAAEDYYNSLIGKGCEYIT